MEIRTYISVKTHKITQGIIRVNVSCVAKVEGHTNANELGSALASIDRAMLLLNAKEFSENMGFPILSSVITATEPSGRVFYAGSDKCAWGMSDCIVATCDYTSRKD